jgi:hypothetical protein
MAFAFKAPENEFVVAPRVGTTVVSIATGTLPLDPPPVIPVLAVTAVIVPVPPPPVFIIPP